MAFFTSRPSASLYGPNYSGLFRLIDEFNNYAAEASDATPSSNNRSIASANANKRRSLAGTFPVWTPKFDLQETPNTYVLHGEFPGIDKKDIHIEFTDERTLSVRGRSEHSHTHSSEDDDDAVMAQGESKDSAGKEAVHQDKSNKQANAQRQQQQPKLKYWVSERSFGEFARSFTFPTHVDASGVVAKLDNGVLNLVIPKASKPEGKKITVQ